MQLASRTQCIGCCSSTASRRPQLHIVAQALPNSNGYIPPSPSSLDRPAGGGSRSHDLPRSSDIVYSNWGPSSDLLRPSGGANRGSVFSAVSSSSEGGSIDRPGGRGGRSDMSFGPSSDIPTPQDPATGRPGGRGGRDLGLESGSTDPIPQDPAYGRPGGRGGRDLGLEGGDVPVAPVSIDRPGGRGGRDAAAGGGGDGGDSGDNGNQGGSGGNGDSDDSGSSSDDSGLSFGQGVAGIALYAGVIAAAWYGHKTFFAKPDEEPKKSCCGCSKGKEEPAKPAKGKKK